MQHKNIVKPKQLTKKQFLAEHKLHKAEPATSKKASGISNTTAYLMKAAALLVQGAQAVNAQRPPDELCHDDQGKVIPCPEADAGGCDTTCIATLSSVGAAALLTCLGVFIYKKCKTPVDPLSVNGDSKDYHSIEITKPTL